MLNDAHCRCTCQGATVWVTGPSTADRLATAYALAERLTAERRRVEVLDRFRDLGADPTRTGLLAEVLARNEIVVIVPCAAQSVSAVRERHAQSATQYVEVAVAEQDRPQTTAAVMHGLLTEHA